MSYAYRVAGGGIERHLDAWRAALGVETALYGPGFCGRD